MVVVHMTEEFRDQLQRRLKQLASLHQELVDFVQVGLAETSEEESPEVQAARKTGSSAAVQQAQHAAREPVDNAPYEHPAVAGESIPVSDDALKEAAEYAATKGSAHVWDTGEAALEEYDAATLVALREDHLADHHDPTTCRVCAVLNRRLGLTQ